MNNFPYRINDVARKQCLQGEEGAAAGGERERDGRNEDPTETARLAELNKSMHCIAGGMTHEK